MIEKIPDQIPVQTGEWRGTTFDIIPKETFGMACRKINEIVDAVNDITDWIKRTDETIVKYGIKPISEKIAQGFKNLQDPYAEQRKWIGCVCRFWYDNPNDTLLDYLNKIQTGKDGVEYYAKESGDWFPHCKPILPTDPAIYKGGNNE